jgi:hypothetical protein
MQLPFQNISEPADPFPLDPPSLNWPQGQLDEYLMSRMRLLVSKLKLNPNLQYLIKKFLKGSNR